MTGMSVAACRRLTVANSRIAGAALGTIIAIIITHHIANIRSAWPADHGSGSIGMSAMLVSMPAPASR